MIRVFPTIFMLLAAAGCHMLPGPGRREAPVDPALPMTLTPEELVDYLNGQSGNLRAWKSHQVRLKVRQPRMFDQTLTGSIACESPNRFHLVAGNTIALADLGSNSERCWFHVKPDSDDVGVVSWRHKDAGLLEQLPATVPYINPEWLTLVLGMKQLNAEDYELTTDTEKRQLLLTAVETSPGGRTLRRIIRVDTVSGVVSEHAVFDRDARLIVRARLSHHQPFNGHLIPCQVDLEFPRMDMGLELSFRAIETDPQIDSAMWKVPREYGARNTDLVQLVAAAHDHRHPRNTSAGSGRGSFQTASTLQNRNARNFREAEPPGAEVIREPVWETASETGSDFSQKRVNTPRIKRWPWFHPW